MNYKHLVVGLCVAAGILYNSWPLGYVLDNVTIRHSLASNLELAGHPYYWLFILGDVLTGVCVIAAVLIMRYELGSALHSQSMRLACTGLLMFGLFTGACALLPYQCTITPLLRCSAHYGRGLSLDVITSSLAALGLFIGLSGLVLANWKSKTLSPLTRFTQAAWAGWTASGLWFAELALTNHNALFSQDILLLTSGLAVVVIGLNLAAALPV